MTYSNTALEAALGHYLAEVPEGTPAEALEKVRQGDDSVVIWEPFENWHYEELADQIEETATILTDTFGDHPVAGQVVMKTEVIGQYAVTTTRSKGVYKVTYGEHSRTFKGLWEAVSEHESCVIHAVTCAGLNI